MNIPKNITNALLGLAGVLTVFVAILGIKSIREIGYVGRSSDTMRTINVEGTGEAVAIPDIAAFSFSVTGNAKTVAEAQAKATEQINGALKAVRDAGVADKDIQTQSYNINPHYEYQNAICQTQSPIYSSVSYCPPGKSVLTGYDVSQSVSVKIRDLTKAGAIFTAVGALNVENVNGLSFAVDEPETVRAEARAKAIASAKAKAETLARALGVRLAGIVSYSENGSYPRPMMYGLGMADSVSTKGSSVPEIPIGETKITSNVTITYEIR